MPSPAHELVVEIVRQQPRLILGLLASTQLPAWDDVSIADGALSDLQPTEYRADLVLQLQRQGVVLSLAVEAQLAVDEHKRFSWPVYATTLRARHGCGAGVVVVTPSTRVAAWAAQDIALGTPACTFRPMVIGPADLPPLGHVDPSRSAPELAVLSVLAHAKKPADAPRVLDTVRFLGDLDDPAAKRYIYAMLAGLPKALRAAVEEKMLNIPDDVLDEAPIFRDQRLIGERRGLSKGRQEERAHAILRVLATRGLAVTESERERILTCQDADQLLAWHNAAVTVASTRALLEA